MQRSYTRKIRVEQKHVFTLSVEIFYCFFPRKPTAFLPFVDKNRKFRLEIQMVQSSFLFSRSNRNDRKNPVPFVNSHSTRFTSAFFPAFRHCKCSRLICYCFLPAVRDSGLAKRHTGKILYHSNRSFRANDLDLVAM